MTKIPVIAPAVQTPRSIHLMLYGAGPRPCVDGARHWLGCASLADQPQMCPYLPGKSCTFARPTSRTRSISFSEEPLQQAQAAEDR
jgi:hypothetical protein